MPSASHRFEYVEDSFHSETISNLTSIATEGLWQAYALLLRNVGGILEDDDMLRRICDPGLSKTAPRGCARECALLLASPPPLIRIGKR